MINLLFDLVQINCSKNQSLLEFKVIRKFFLNHNKSVRWHLGDYEKHNFFPFEGL